MNTEIFNLKKKINHLANIVHTLDLTIKELEYSEKATKEMLYNIARSCVYGSQDVQEQQEQQEQNKHHIAITDENSFSQNNKNVIYRHLRYNNFNPKGGETYAFEINKNSRVVKAGIAACSLKDRFNKKKGREIALQRLQTDPIVFFHETDGTFGLIDSLWDEIYKNRNLLSKQNQQVVEVIVRNRLGFV